MVYYHIMVCHILLKSKQNVLIFKYEEPSFQQWKLKQQSEPVVHRKWACVWLAYDACGMKVEYMHDIRYSEWR